MDFENRQVKRLSQLMAGSFIAEILLCWKLWFPFNREFPMLSAFRWLDFSFGVIGNGILSFILLLSLFFVLIDKHRKLSITLTLCCLILLILEDITRLQPWVYIQAVILFLASFNKDGKEKSVLSGILLAVSLVYFWSGIQKLNLGFLKDTFPWVISTFGFDFHVNASEPLGTVNYLFVVIPIIELTVGLSLLFSKTRKAGIIVGIFMHLFILICLGPLGHNWNAIVIPWNLSLILFLLVFYREKNPMDILNQIKSFQLNYVVVALFGLMPALNFVGHWDDNLSSAMYSGTHSNIAFFFNTKEEKPLTLPREKATTENTSNQTSKTWLAHWSINEIGVPLYPAYRYYIRYSKKLCQQAKKPSARGIEITTRTKLMASKTTKKCDCTELLKARN